MSDRELIERLSKNDIAVFNLLVKTYYERLCRFALKFTVNYEPAEEIVQDVFVGLWNKRHTLEINTSLSAYLYAAVKYRSINHLKCELRKPMIESEFPETISSQSHNADEAITVADLEKLIVQAIETLPKKCRIIYELSRNGGLTYKEIAAELDISNKTVETQMTTALFRIRIFLNKYWDKLLSFLLFSKLF